VRLSARVIYEAGPLLIHLYTADPRHRHHHHL